MPTPRTLAAVGAALAVVAALGWLALHESSESDVSSPSAEPSDAAPAEPSDHAADHASTLAPEPVADERAPAPVAAPPVEAAAESAPTAAPPWTPEQVDAVLESFRGEWPRTDELLALVDDLAAGAVVDEDSLRKDQYGRLVGTLEWPEQGLTGEFTLQSEELEVTLVRPPTGGEGYALTDLQIQVPLDGSTRGGSAAVQHHPDASSAAVWDALGPEANVIGWSVGSSVEAGTSASPVLAKVTGEGAERGVMIGRPRPEGAFADAVERFPAQSDPWRHDVAGFDAWRAKLEPYLDGRR